MPPKRGKKAAAPATPVLDGCKIALSGTFPGVTQATIKTRAEALGATVASTVTDDATHVVATESDYNKPSPKVAKAQSLGIHIVSLDWLSLCEQNNTREPEKNFVPCASAKNDSAQTDASQPAPSQANGTASTSSRTRKRVPSAADNASDNETAPKAKRTRERKEAVVKAEEDEDTAMQDANDVADTQTEEEKKGKAKTERAMGEGQVAKKGTIIKVDEGCPFMTSKVYIDDAGIIYDAKLNQSNRSHNNNKFYIIQVSYTEQPVPVHAL